MTFSAADMQWEDLHQHFLGYSTVATEDDHTRRKFIWDMVQNHPHIVAHYLDARFRLFKEHVLRPFFGYTDEWSRYEWQARGSGHLHCLFWIPSDLPSMLLRPTPEPNLPSTGVSISPPGIRTSYGSLMHELLHPWPVRM